MTKFLTNIIQKCLFSSTLQSDYTSISISEPVLWYAAATAWLSRIRGYVSRHDLRQSHNDGKLRSIICLVYLLNRRFETTTLASLRTILVLTPTLQQLRYIQNTKNLQSYNTSWLQPMAAIKTSGCEGD